MRQKAIYVWVACIEKNGAGVKLLFITGSFPPMKCGVGDYTYNLTKAITSHPNLRVGILTSNTAFGDQQICGVQIFPLMNRWNLCEATKIIRVIKAWSPDIVHIQYPTQGYGRGLLPDVLPIISFLMGKKVVQTWHESFSWLRAPQLFLKAVVPSGLVVVRSQYRELLHPLLRWALLKKRYTYIPNASSIPRANLEKHEILRLRNQYLKGKQRLVVFFGFIHPQKGVELLFDIADPASDHIVAVGGFDENSGYYREIAERYSSGPWFGNVTLTGFLPENDISELLAAADAVVLPFRNGGGEWNTSIHAATLQGTFVLTTSATINQYDRSLNVYYAKVGDVGEMRSALDLYSGRRRKYNADIDFDQWSVIAEKHHSLYRALLEA